MEQQANNVLDGYSRVPDASCQTPFPRQEEAP
jgi:hypothetical protein